MVRIVDTIHFTVVTLNFGVVWLRFVTTWAALNYSRRWLLLLTYRGRDYLIDSEASDDLQGKLSTEFFLTNIRPSSLTSLDWLSFSWSWLLPFLIQKVTKSCRPRWGSVLFNSKLLSQLQNFISFVRSLIREIRMRFIPKSVLHFTFSINIAEN